MFPSDFVKTTMGDAHSQPPGGTCSINFRSFTTTNQQIFEPHNKRG